MEPIISLCLPTNGVKEWVFPVLDSIYNQNINNNLFEVIVTNNGQNVEFDFLMQEYARKHNNLLYSKNTSYMFYNQLEALKLASGKYLKFVNHRGLFTDGALQRMLDVVMSNENDKPVIYFSDGVLKEEYYELKNFDEFVGCLKRYVSWTTGVGIWKSDYDKIKNNLKVDKISPHSCILFSERGKSRYLIDNYIFSKDIDPDQKKKGNYDLFKAFAVEEITITLNLYVDGDISAETFKKVKKDYKRFIAELYFDYCVRREPCSYKLKSFNETMGIFFKKSEIVDEIVIVVFSRIINKVKSIVRGKNDTF